MTVVFPDLILLLFIHDGTNISITFQVLGCISSECLQDAVIFKQSKVIQSSLTKEQMVKSEGIPPTKNLKKMLVGANTVFPSEVFLEAYLS